MQVTGGVATFNLVVQVMLMAVILTVSGLLVSVRRKPHCRAMRVVIVAQLALVGVIMAPQMARYLANWSGFSVLTTELLIHMAFGVAAVILAIYLGLSLLGLLKRPRRFYLVMRVTLGVWVISLGLGVHLFWFIWH